MTLPQGPNKISGLRAHKCAELCVQPFKWLRLTKIFRFHGQMQSPKQPQSPCICSRAFTFLYVMKWQNSSHLYCAGFSKRAREPVLRKWSDAGTPPSEILPAYPICQVSVPPSLLPFLAWKLLLNYVHFTIFVSWPRVQPRTPLNDIIETTRPNVKSITLGAHPPLRETQQSFYVNNCARASRFPHCKGSSAPTTLLLLHLLSLVVGAPPIFFFPYVLQITFHHAPNTTINNITAGNRTNLSIDNNVHSGG